MVDGIYGCSGGFQAPSAACEQGAIVLAMFLASDCLPNRPKTNARDQFELKMQLKGRKSSQKRVGKCGYRASLNGGAPDAGCPLCPCQNRTPPPPHPPPRCPANLHLIWLRLTGRLPVTQLDLQLVRKPCADGSSSSASCSLSCPLQALPPFSVIKQSLVISAEFLGSAEHVTFFRF